MFQRQNIFEYKGFFHQPMSTNINHHQSMQIDHRHSIHFKILFSPDFFISGTFYSRA
tara:strand:- start:4629 stop:4799 length:171 start_codon:yes stop_codon:yes gene_type:complete